MSVQICGAADVKADTIEQAKGRARTKKTFKLELTPEERAAHDETILEKAENELAGALL